MPTPGLDRIRLALDREALEIDRQKLLDAQEKTRIEKEKAVWTSKWPIWMAGFSVVITAVSVAVTAVLGYVNQRAQTQKDFQIKAAELIMKAGSANEAKANADLLKALFPEFKKAFSEKSDDGTFDAFGGDIVQAKIEFLKLLLDKNIACDQKVEGVRLWRRFFGEDNTFKVRPPELEFELKCQQE